MSLENSIAGNINGGGIGQYAIGGSSEVCDSDYDRYSYTKGVSPMINYNYDAPGALVIIAKGNVTVNGQIIASATEGKGPTGGWLNGLYKSGVNGYYFSMSGTGAIPPSGGGAITIICNTLTVNGKIDTNGLKQTFEDGADYRSQICTNGYYFNANNAENGYIGEKLKDTSTAGHITTTCIKGSEGGKGGTFISTAGDIKVYTGVSE